MSHQTQRESLLSMSLTWILWGTIFSVPVPISFCQAHRRQRGRHFLGKCINIYYDLLGSHSSKFQNDFKMAPQLGSLWETENTFQTPVHCSASASAKIRLIFLFYVFSHALFVFCVSHFLLWYPSPVQRTSTAAATSLVSRYSFLSSVQSSSISGSLWVSDRAVLNFSEFPPPGALYIFGGFLLDYFLMFSEVLCLWDPICYDILVSSYHFILSPGQGYILALSHPISIIKV